MRIEHIAIYVEDLEAAKAFFIKYFSALAGTLYHNQTSGFRSYFLTLDGGARLELMNKPGLSADCEGGARLGYSHLAFSLGSKEAVDSLTAALKEDGWRVVSGPRTTGDGYYESCIAAIENILIELTV